TRSRPGRKWPRPATFERIARPDADESRPRKQRICISESEGTAGCHASLFASVIRYGPELSENRCRWTQCDRAAAGNRSADRVILGYSGLGTARLPPTLPPQRVPRARAAAAAAHH